MQWLMQLAREHSTAPRSRNGCGARIDLLIPAAQNESLVWGTASEPPMTCRAVNTRLGTRKGTEKKDISVPFPTMGHGGTLHDRVPVSGGNDTFIDKLRNDPRHCDLVLLRPGGNHLRT